MNKNIFYQVRDINNKLSDENYCAKVRENFEPAKEIIEYAVRNTEFYSKFKSGVSLYDLPVMNKTSLNENYAAHISKEFDEIFLHKMHTSGSTGIPFTVVQNLEKRTRHIADLKVFGELCGYHDGEPMCYLRAKPTATKEEQKEQNIWQFDICNLNPHNLTEYFEEMVQKKCTALIAYPSTLKTAVEFWSENFKNTSCIKTIISTSETLTEEVREKLKAFFGNECNVVARYSNTEQGILGQENGEDGKYLLNWASYFFEILKLDSDEQASAGELGRIVITDLYNRAFPLLRYDTGDVGKIIMSEKGFPYLAELYGRRMDLIYDTKGSVVSPFLLCRTMRFTNGIEQWQFIQKDQKKYILKISSSKEISLEKEILQFKQTLGSDAEIDVMYVNEIPVMNSLKRKLIVSNYIPKKPNMHDKNV